MGEELIEFFMELLRSIPFKELAVGVLGAIIGGRFTLKGARESHALEFAREKVRSLEGAKRALVLIQIEITAACDVFYS